MISLISCGHFNKFFFILFISIFFQFINEAIYGFNYHENIFDEVKIFQNKGHEYFSKHILIHLIFSYIGLFIFIVPFSIYEVFFKKKEKNKKISVFSQKYRKKKKMKQYFWILLVAFLWVVEDIFFIFYSFILGGLEFCLLEILIVCYLSSKMLHTSIYKHHKLAMLLNFFPLILKYILIVLGAKLEKKNSNLIYIRHMWVIPVGILFYLILAFIRSFANLKIKEIIDFNFTSINKVISIFGLMGAIITSILCIITSNINCNLGEIESSVCKVSENNSSNNYIDSFSIYHNIFQGYSNGDSSQIKFEIMVIIFGVITFAISKYSFVLAIKGLNPVFFAFTFSILFLFRKIALIINTLIISKSFYIKDVTGITKLKFSFDMIGDILYLISFLIYAEILELNFCGFNYNTAKNISKRELDDNDRPFYPDPDPYDPVDFFDDDRGIDILY